MRKTALTAQEVAQSVALDRAAAALREYRAAKRVGVAMDKAIRRGYCAACHKDDSLRRFNGVWYCVDCLRDAEEHWYGDGSDAGMSLDETRRDADAMNAPEGREA